MQAIWEPDSTINNNSSAIYTAWSIRYHLAHLDYMGGWNSKVLQHPATQRDCRHLLLKDLAISCKSCCRADMPTMLCMLWAPCSKHSFVMYSFVFQSHDDKL